MRQEYVVVQELKSSSKLTEKWFVRDAIFVLVYIIAANLFTELVHPFLQAAYMIFSIFIACVLTSHTRNNPKKRVYHSIYYWLIKSRCVYHSI